MIKMNVGRKDFVSLVLSLLSREVRAGAAAVTGGVLPTALPSMSGSAYSLVQPRASGLDLPT